MDDNHVGRQCIYATSTLYTWSIYNRLTGRLTVCPGAWCQTVMRPASTRSVTGQFMTEASIRQATLGDIWLLYLTYASCFSPDSPPKGYLPSSLAVRLAHSSRPPNTTDAKTGRIPASIWRLPPSSVKGRRHSWLDGIPPLLEPEVSTRFLPIFAGCPRIGILVTIILITATGGVDFNR